MDKKFKLDKSLYVMMIFICVIGCILIVVRSDFILQNEFFNTQKEKTIKLASAEDMQSYKMPVYLILTEEGQEPLIAQIIARLEKMGNEAVSLPVEQFKSMDEEYEGVVVAAENLDLIQDPASLLRYVENGGGLFFAMRPSPGPFLSSTYQQLGMTEIGSFIETTGLEFAEPVFNTDRSRVFQAEQLVNSSLRVRLSPSADLHLTSGQGVPLLWKKGYGKGQFVFFNGTLLSQASGTGLLTRGLQLLSHETIHPVVNAAPTVLKGFPFPVPKGAYKDEKLSNNDFFRHVFWPFMLRIEAKHDLNYTSSFLADSDEFRAKEISGDQEDLILYGRELLRLGGELGIEGYGQQVMDGRGTASLEKVYGEAFRRMDQALPGYKLHSFMPSIHDGLSEQLNALTRNFGEITAILGPKENGPVFEENGPRAVPSNPIRENDEKAYAVPSVAETVAVLPETFSGFTPDAYSKWLVINSLLADGYFTQVIEPRSLLQDGYNEEILFDFERFAKEVSSEAPWLKRTPFIEAAASTKAIDRQTVYTEKTKEGMTFHVNKVSAPSYFFFFTDKKIKDTKGCKIVKAGYQLYLIESSKLSFSIGLE